MKKFKYLFLVLGLLILFALIYISINYYKSRSKQQVEATSTTTSLSSSDDWNAAAKTNITVDGGGTFSINSKGQSDITGGSFSYASCAVPPQTASNIHDGNEGTTVGLGCVGNYVEWDFGEMRTIGKVRTLAVEVDTDMGTTPELAMQYWDGNVWQNLVAATSLGFSWEEHTITPAVTGSKIRYVHQMNPPGSNEEAVDFYEVQVLANATGILTTGATQIDGGEDFWEWEAITPAQTTPANTSITYRYRTSTDGATWTAWVADIGSVTSRSGGDKYRYLQVEATLSNTDGASTPTIDSYDIDYHTEVKPGAPTAQTAVVD